MRLDLSYEQKLRELGGILPNGKGKLRVVTPIEAVRPHGSLKGQPRYFDPESGKQMPFLVLEQWHPSDFAGDKDKWPYELLGAYPADCDLDCCQRGMWSMLMPLTNQFGEYIPFSEVMMAAIERQIKKSREWGDLSEEDRTRYLDADLSSAKQKNDDSAMEIVNANRDHYLTHKEEMDNADNRVRIGFGKAELPVTKGGKMPIGSPLEKL